MLKAPKRQANLRLAQTHEALFADNYELMHGWALKLTDTDQSLAEDLLHDTFIHFTLTRPELTTIDNLEGYLYVVMRNLHLSQLRKATRTPFWAMSVVEFDSVDVGMWASDPRDRLRLRDELAAVCQYACVRKQTSKGGSVLILRFFHGYYPEEIAQILRSTRAVVHERLRLARAEARTYMECPEKLGVIGNAKVKPVNLKATDLNDDLRFELRRAIYSSRQDEHVDDIRLSAAYKDAGDDGPETWELAHIVSCNDCLEAVNTQLELPPLASRYPLDTLGKDPKDRDGGSSSGGGGSKVLDTFARRRDAHYHHEPQELCIAVNGQLQGYQKVVSGKGELTLILDDIDQPGFVEVFSEQGFRLLMLNVEPPPVGDGRQSAHVEFSSGRTIDVNLNFCGVHPVLRINYEDPEIAKEAAVKLSVAPNTDTASIALPIANAATQKPSFFDSVKAWFEPIRIAVVAALLLAGILAVWFVNQPTPTEHPTVRTVLKQARDAEFALAPTAEKVLHRNYQVEEWSNGSLKSRWRVDEWQKKTASARRTYDEEGQMVSGKWIAENGIQQIFNMGEELRTVYKGRQDPREEDRIYVPEPTANAFANLIDHYGVASAVSLEENTDSHIFSFEDRKGETVQKGLNERLIAASLTLDRGTLMPLTQAIVLQIGGEMREYRYSDVRVEQRPISEVSPLIFEPEAELAKGATKVTKPLEIEVPVSVIPSVAGGAVPASRGATLETEVDVMRALDSINALSGDQINVTRTAAGQLKVVGIVDSPSRKTEILNALDAVKNHSGFSIDIQTASEAASRQRQDLGGQIGKIRIDSVTASTSQQLAVEPELRAYFARRGVSDEMMNGEVRSFANSVLNRAEALGRNALALKSLSERFSSAEIERLESKKRDEWRRLVRAKAAAVAGDVRSLRSQLGSVFGNLAAGGGDAANVDNADQAAQAAQRLFGLAAACERQVNQSFSVSASGGSSAVKTVQFWRNLSQMTAIAGELQKF